MHRADPQRKPASNVEITDGISPENTPKFEYGYKLQKIAPMTDPNTENEVERETVETQGTQAILSCERCKRRKIKCDRTKPACRSCARSARNCSYPTVAQKPGPKPGAPQRKKRKHGSALNSSAPAPLTFKNYSPFSSNNKNSNENTDILNLNAHGLPTFGLTTIRPQHQTRSSDSSRLDVILNQVNPQLQPQTILAHESEPSSRRGLALSQLLHPSHEPVQMRSKDVLPEKNDELSKDAVVESLCRDLEISIEAFHSLLPAYFDNMTAFSLFHQPTFLTRLCVVPSPLQRRALIAAIFAFSSRFKDIGPSSEAHTKVPSPETFLAIAEESIDEALKACLDDSPPLCLLQALILTTFHQLIKGVRGRSWRSVGTCVRIAYDMKLHIIDKVMPSTGKLNPEFSCLNALDEERRRAWWAIWEFDVFASTVRRLPTAIDWQHNETWLPMDDELWFAGTCSTSCYLNRDATQAWKDLEKTGNKSPKAWFIVVNALMRCALFLSYPQNNTPSQSSGTSRSILSVEEILDIHVNALYCLSSAIPSTVSYQQEFLTFSRSHTKSSIQVDSAKHAIHIMSQLCRFIIYHYRVFNSTSRHLSVTNPSSNSSSTPAQLDPKDQAAWNQYLAAANEIITVVRNSSPSHVKYVNPLLSSTIWLAAASQVAARSFGGLLIDKRVAKSNLDLLQMNLSGYVNFWGVSSTLQHNLDNLESQLEGIRNEGVEADCGPINGGFQTCPQGEGEGEGATQYERQELSDNQVARLQTPNTENNELPRFDMEGWMLDENILGNTTNLWGWGLEDLLNYGGVDANLGDL